MTSTAVLAPEPDESRIMLRSPADLVAATPFLLHFHPTDSLVVHAFHDRSFLGTARVDLPEPGDELVVADSLVETMTGQGATLLAVLGYGPANRVDAVVPATVAVARGRGMRVTDGLRVDAGRWWSYTCQEPRCCPPEGTPVEGDSSEVCARFAFEGIVALPDRDTLVQRVAPQQGAARLAIAEATDRAEAALLAWLHSLPEWERATAVLAEGNAAVDGAIARYAAGGVLDDDELARLTVLLTCTPVRDQAWLAITAEQPHLSLWSDVVRRADHALVPAPASLLAFTAWCHGDSVLAGLALDRAQTEDPSYSMASLVRQAVLAGPPPAIFQDWGTARWEQRLADDDSS